MILKAEKRKCATPSAVASVAPAGSGALEGGLTETKTKIPIGTGIGTEIETETETEIETGTSIGIESSGVDKMMVTAIEEDIKAEATTAITTMTTVVGPITTTQTIMLIEEEIPFPIEEVSD